MQNTGKMLKLAGAAVLSQACVPALAHHSFAQFDTQKTITLEGTIKEFQWTNPHTWVELLVKDASGKDVDWSIEGISENSLSRTGWKRTSLNPGDKAIAIIHPLKNGAIGGSLVSISVNGQHVGDTRTGL